MFFGGFFQKKKKKKRCMHEELQLRYWSLLYSDTNIRHKQMCEKAPLLHNYRSQYVHLNVKADVEFKAFVC